VITQASRVNDFFATGAHRPPVRRADVILTYRERKDEGQAVAAQIEELGSKAALIQLDVAQTAGFDAFFKRMAETLQANWERKDFDFLINNAGIDVYSPALVFLASGSRENCFSKS
jgi:NAD(P)-dependent dehydrogenase (short-subunit alcohol dehydrogenase family)